MFRVNKVLFLLLLLNFNQSQLFKPQRRCASHHLSHPVDDLSCCCHKYFSNEPLLSVQEGFVNLDEDKESFSFYDNWLDQQVQASFNTDPISMEMSEIYKYLVQQNQGFGKMLGVFGGKQD